MTENPFPDNTDVQVRYPANTAQEHGPRDQWSWLPGYIVEQCGADEWMVCVTDDRLAVPGIDGEPLYPCCFRDSSEIRTREEVSNSE